MAKIVRIVKAKGQPDRVLVQRQGQLNEGDMPRPATHSKKAVRQVNPFVKKKMLYR